MTVKKTYTASFCLIIILGDFVDILEKLRIMHPHASRQQPAYCVITKTISAKRAIPINETNADKFPDLVQMFQI